MAYFFELFRRHRKPFELNPIQQDAVASFLGKSDIFGHVLTAESFRRRSWFDSKHHLQALEREIFLLRSTYQDALDELEQRFKGFNGPQSKALVNFQRQGLLRQHLVDRPWLNQEVHFQALERLLEDGMKLDKALDTLKNLKPFQLRAIVQEFTVGEINSLTEYQVEALLAFSQYRLSTNDLKAQPELFISFDDITLVKAQLKLGKSFPVALNLLRSLARDVTGDVDKPRATSSSASATASVETIPFRGILRRA